MTKKSYLLGVLKGLIIAYGTTLLLLLLLSLFMYKLGWRENVVAIAIMIIYVLASAISGYVSSGIMQSRRFLWGCLTGLFYVMILWLISIVLNKGYDGLENQGLTTFFLCIGGGMLGGMIR